MATALEMVTRAMRLARVIGKGEIPDNEEAQDGLTALNAMLDSWRLERLSVYQIVQGSHVWTAADSSMTFGTGGDVTTRPVAVDSAFWQDANANKYSLTLLTEREQYDRIVAPSTQSTIPEYLFYEKAFPLGVVYLYPVPSEGGTLLLNTWQALQEFSALTTELALPPGYKRAIEYSLAEEYGPEFGVQVPVSVIRIASKAKTNLKRVNAPRDVMSFPTELLGRRRFDINIE
jgi:hypothetical protein